MGAWIQGRVDALAAEMAKLKQIQELARDLTRPGGPLASPIPSPSSGEPDHTPPGAPHRH